MLTVALPFHCEHTRKLPRPLLTPREREFFLTTPQAETRRRHNTLPTARVLVRTPFNQEGDPQQLMWVTERSGPAPGSLWF